MAASVWIALMTVARLLLFEPPNGSCDWSDVRTGRFSAETMPDVTVPDNPSGDPIARTGSPTRTLAELPNAAALRPDLSTLTTARSDAGSVPTTRPATLLPSLNVTRREPPSAAAATTWLLVRM